MLFPSTWHRCTSGMPTTAASDGRNAGNEPKSFWNESSVGAGRACERGYGRSRGWPHGQKRCPKLRKAMSGRPRASMVLHDRLVGGVRMTPQRVLPVHGESGEYPLDPLQRAAVRDQAEVIAVTGGSGTGKTQAVVGRVGALLDRGVSPGHITCLVGNPERARDLRRRLSAHPKIRAKANRVFVGTPNRLAHVILRQGGAGLAGCPEGYSVWNVEQVVEMMSDISPKEYGMKLSRKEIRAALDWYVRNVRSRPDDPPIPARHQVWRDIAVTFAGEARAQGAVLLDDLPALAIRAMEADTHYRDRWRKGRCRHLLVDGCEDLNPREWRLIEVALGRPYSMTITWDDNGLVNDDADPGLFRYLRLHYPQMRVHHLRMNQRASRNLVDLATCLKVHEDMSGLADDRQVCDGLARRPPQLHEVVGTLTDMDAAVLRELQELHKDGTPWGEMAVLDRHGRAAGRMLTQLIHRAIPHHVLGRTERKGPTDARCIAALLTLTVNPMDWQALRIAAAPGFVNKDRLLGLPAALEIRRLARERGVSLVDAVARDPGRFPRDREALAGLVECWKRLRAATDLPGAEFGDLLEIAQQYVSDARGRAPGGDGALDNRTFNRLCRALPRMHGEDLGRYLIRILDRWDSSLNPQGSYEPAGVAIGSFPAAKGLQRRAVLVLDVSDQTIPGKVGPHSSRWGAEQRLFLLAATRATELVCFYHLADTGQSDRCQPSRFILPLCHMLERVEVPYRGPWPDSSDSGPEFLMRRLA